MGLINLPSLVQKVRIDTKSMKEAQAEADKFGIKMVRNTEAVDKAMARLRESQRSMGVSTHEARLEVESATEDVSKYAKGLNDVEPKTRRTKKSTDELGGSLGFLKRHIEENARGFNLFKIATERLKLPFIVSGLSGLVSASTALGAASGALATQLAPVVGLYGAAPAVILATKTSMGVLNEAMKELTNKKKGNDLVKPWFELNKVGAKAAIPGLVNGLKTMNPILVQLQNGYKLLGKTIGTTFTQQAKELVKTPGFVKDVGTIMKNNASVAGTFGAALKPIIITLKNIMLAADPMVQAIAGTFLKGANTAEKFSSNTVRMTQFFNKAWATATSLGRSLLNIGVAVKNVFGIGSKSIGIDFVGGLEQGTKKLRDMSGEAKNVTKIKKYFEDTGPIIKELGGILGDFIKDIVGLGGGDANKSLLKFLQIVHKQTLPAFSELAQTTSKNLLPVLANLGTTYAKFNEVIGTSPLITTIDNFANLGKVILDVVNKVPGLGQFLGTMLLIKTTIGGLSFVGKATGITKFIDSIGSIGKGGAAGAKGFAGIIQGMRGAEGEAVTLSNKIGSALGSIPGGAVSGTKSIGSGIKKGLTAAKNEIKLFGSTSKESLKMAGQDIASFASSAGSKFGQFAKLAGSGLKSFGSTLKSGIASGISSLVSVFPGLINGLKAAALAVKAFTVSLLTNPVFLIVAAIVAFIGVLVLLYKKNETFRNFVNTAWADIQKAISVTVNWIVNTAWPWLKNTFENIVRVVANVVVNIIIWWNKVKDFLAPIFSTIGNIISTYFHLYVSIISAVLRTIWTVITSIWSAIVGIVTTYVNIIRAVISTAFSIIATVIRTYINIAKTVIVAAWNIIKEVISTAVNVIRAIVTGNFGAIPGIIAGALGRIVGIAAGAMGNVLGAIRNGIGGILGAVGGLAGQIVGSIGNLGNLLYNKGREIVQGLIDGIGSMFGALRNAGSNLLGTIRNMLPGSPVKEGPLRVLNHGYAGRQIVKMVADGMTSTNAMQVAMQTQVTKARAVLAPVQQSMSGIGASVPVASGTASLPLQRSASSQSAPINLTAETKVLLDGEPLRAQTKTTVKNESKNQAWRANTGRR